MILSAGKMQFLCNCNGVLKKDHLALLGYLSIKFLYFGKEIMSGCSGTTKKYIVYDSLCQHFSKCDVPLHTGKGRWIDSPLLQKIVLETEPPSPPRKFQPLCSKLSQQHTCGFLWMAHWIENCCSKPNHFSSGLIRAQSTF